jgi:2'-5' RNA ligase
MKKLTTRVLCPIISRRFLSMAQPLQLVIAEVFMRLFLALDTADISLDLKKLRVNLNKGKNFEHKWIPENQRHIPICPLGEMGQSKLMVIDEVIKSAIISHRPFALKLQGVWAYPRQDEARVLWVGVQNSKELRELQTHLIRDLGAHYAEVPDERPFRPHLPVVRLRNFRNVSDIISPYKNTDFGKVLVDQLVLYEMTAGGAFPTYRKVKSYALNYSATFTGPHVSELPFS